MVAVWLVRVLDGGIDPAGVGASSFADVDEGAWWAPFVERLSALEVTAGCGVDPLRFCPDDPVTRAQMATFVARAEGLVSLPGSDESYRIGFTRQHLPVDRIFVMNANGARQRLLIHESSGRDAAWSPDGTRIAFTGAPPTGADGPDTASVISVVGAYDGSDPRNRSRLLPGLVAGRYPYRLLPFHGRP